MIRKTIAISGNIPPVLNILLSILFGLSSCQKFVDVGPPKTQMVKSTVFSSDQTATAAIAGIYSNMMGDYDRFTSGGNQSVSYLAGLSADEFDDYSFYNLEVQYSLNSLTADNFFVLYEWLQPYQYIYGANSIIEGLSQSREVSARTKQILAGEAKFVRAFCYFYLVNQFGDVPIATSTNYQSNSSASRSSSTEVYAQIVSDLKEAQTELGDDYVYGSNNQVSTERTRPNKWAATALLARTYLYMKDWQNAEQQAALVISNNSRFSLLPNLNDVFIKNSKEAIWQLQPIMPGLNTFDGDVYVVTSYPYYVALTNQLVNSFEPLDKRRDEWVGSYSEGNDRWYYPYKYKLRYGVSAVMEYSMVLRVAEQYLIRAEARAEQNNINGALEDLNIIRNRAGLSNYLGPTDGKSLLAAIFHERQVELFSEWGHRWFDLRRSGSINSVLKTLKGSDWQESDTLYPIPQQEIQKDPNLTQNNGY